jgi:outer membrane protein TolC
MIAPIAVVDSAITLQDLLSQALDNRPELGRDRAIVEAEQARLKQGKYGLFLPKIELGYSRGNFGGGPGTGNSFDDSRDDFYGMVYWQFDNLGLGNGNNIKKQRARVNVAEALEQQAVTDVIAEMKTAHTELKSAERQLDLVRRAVDSARRSYELNNERIFENKGLPLEALQSMKALAEAESLYLAVATKYNLSQLRLASSIGRGPQPAAE